MFEGIGRAKMKPIHIFLKEGVVPVQQKQRPVALHYKDRLKEHINELSKAGVIEGPLESKDATGWVCNPVITHKKWSDTKIRMNLDLRSMKNVVRTTHFPMPTFTELRHNFAGSDRFMSLDMNHAYHQFGLWTVRRVNSCLHFTVHGACIDTIRWSWELTQPAVNVRKQSG